MREGPKAKYRVGIIGCGSHGTRMARAFALNPLTEVVAGVNRSQEGLDLFCSEFLTGLWGRHLEIGIRGDKS